MEFRWKSTDVDLAHRLVGERGSAFFVVCQGGQNRGRNLFRCGRNLVEVTLQALLNEPEPLGFDLQGRSVLLGMRQRWTFPSSSALGSGTAPVV